MKDITDTTTSYDGVVPFPADGLEQDVPKVFIRINIARLSGINPVEQSFCVKFQVEFKMAKSLYDQLAAAGELRNERLFTFSNAAEILEGPYIQTVTVPTTAAAAAATDSNSSIRSNSHKGNSSKGNSDSYDNDATTPPSKPSSSSSPSSRSRSARSSSSTTTTTTATSTGKRRSKRIQKPPPTPPQPAQAVIFKVLLKVKFEQHFNLRDFPCDEHTLQLQLTSNIPSVVPTSNLEEEARSGKPLMIQFVRNTEKVSVSQAHAYFMERDMWALEPELFEEQIKQYPHYWFLLKIRRLPWYHFYNTSLPAFVLTTTGFAAFAMSEASDRLNTTLTLILTQVAFKQVASSSIPQVNYLTWLDQYTLFACALLIGIYVYMAVQPESIHDQMAIWIFSTVWGVGNMWFLGHSNAPIMRMLAVLVGLCSVAIVYFERDVQTRVT